MIQFVKFATLDPEGFALIRLDDISSFSESTTEGTCMLITKHNNFLIKGTVDYHIENMRNFIGGEWDAVPEEQVL